jgi:type IV fimbrial biogenesis protein FimT
MKICRGFTLLELMVTIAVLAILTTIAVPSFTDLVQSNRITTQANELVAALTFARTEAVKRGRNVNVAVAAANPGWTVTVTTTDAGGNDVTLRQVERQGSFVNVDAAVNLTFDPSGVPNALAGVGMQPGGCSGAKRRLIEVGRSGQISTTKQNCS